MINYYTIYLAKNDEIVTHGTARECAKNLGKELTNFYCMVKHALDGKNKKYVIVVDKNEEGI